MGGVRGGITLGPEVLLMLGGKRGSEGDVEGTVAGSTVDAQMSDAKDGMDSGGELPYLEFIVRV